MTTCRPDSLSSALDFMKMASHQTFALCQEQAESLANEIESGKLKGLSAAAALRILAIQFESAARTP